MIMICAGVLTLASCLFATERGLCVRYFRKGRFVYRCTAENLLKALYKQGQPLSLSALLRRCILCAPFLYFILCHLRFQGWVIRVKGGYTLTAKGLERARRIVRLHRLWELYLVEKMGVDSMAVHTQAEEMEHILTPELERELTILLKHPKRDPHNQSIPETEQPHGGLHERI